MDANQSKTFWISVGSAVFAIFLIYSWSQEKKAEFYKSQGAMKQVVVAAEDITEMTPIVDSMLDVQSVPAGSMQPSALPRPELALGQFAAAPIKKGEQILDTKLLPPGQLTGLSREVTPGRRAISLPVDEIRGVSKLIKPGDRIDIIAAFDVGDGIKQKKEVRTLLQDIIVIATGDYIANQLPIKVKKKDDGNISLENLRLEKKFSNVTVEVSPEQAQSLVYILATSPGSLFLSLRNVNDRELRAIATTDVNDVLGKPKVRAPTSTRAERPTPPAPSTQPKKQTPRKKKSGRFEEV